MRSKVLGPCGSPDTEMEEAVALSMVPGPVQSQVSPPVAVRPVAAGKLALALAGADGCASPRA